MAFTEQDITNVIAKYERSIEGIRHSFNFAENPDRLDHFPVVLHYIPEFEAEVGGHHNAWLTTINVRSIVFVAPRESAGGKIKILENAAIPFGYLWRTKFQQDAVIRDMLATTSSQRCFLTSGIYGAGGPDLTFGLVEYIGWTMNFTCRSTYSGG